MQKLDWYILRKLLVTFVFCMLLFTVIAVAVDISEKTDDFVKANLTASEIFYKYYIGFIPHILCLLYPLFVFIAVIYFTSKMATQSEIIAILSSGTSYNRFLRPYLVGGVLLGLVLFLANRFVIPKANIIRGNFQTQYLDAADPSKNMYYGSCATCFYLRTDSNTFVGIKNYDTASHTATGFFLDRTKKDKLVYNIRSQSISWDTALKKWKLYHVTERYVDSIGERLKDHDTLVLDLGLQPFELRRDDYLKDKLTTPELVRYIHKEELRGTEGLSALQVERYRRTASAFSVILLTLIGAVIASKKTRGGSGMHLALGIIIASLFMFSDRFSTVFATKSSFPPFLAAWLPNIVFGIVAYRMYRNTPK